MSQEESKPVDLAAQEQAVNEAISELKVSQNGAPSAEVEDEGEGEEGEEGVEQAQPGAATQAPAKKRKSKKKKLKSAIQSLAGSSSSAVPASADSPLPAELLSKLDGDQINALLAANPMLRDQLTQITGGKTDARVVKDMLKNVSVADLATGMAAGKNAKDMANYKFWSTQPVTKFDELGKTEQPDGPIKMIDIERVPKEPGPLVAGFEWVEMNLEDPKELEELYELLTYHYVEDDEAMFRFNYSTSFFNWALKAPGWRRSWHVGVRASQSKKLVAFISGIPVRIRVKGQVVNTSEVNFLCVHKKLRSKRLAPVLIKEITRRCYLEGIFQAIYTGGVVLPTPVASCRYFHRALDWEKLHTVGFSPLPPGSTKQRQIAKYKLPERTATPGLRPMEAKDADAVLDLMQRYLQRTQMAQEYSKDELIHWLIDPESDFDSPKKVVWSYVVEDSQKKITDFFSFYCLESTVIQRSGNHDVIRAAYMFYYGSEAAFAPENKAPEDKHLKARLNELVKDALILAKKAKFDVFNALTLMDNPLFLEDQKFGAGDGQLHYYLYNYRTTPLPAGVDEKNKVDASKRGGVGVVML